MKKEEDKTWTQAELDKLFKSLKLNDFDKRMLNRVKAHINKAKKDEKSE